MTRKPGKTKKRTRETPEKMLRGLRKDLLKFVIETQGITVAAAELFARKTGRARRGK